MDLIQYQQYKEELEKIQVEKIAKTTIKKVTNLLVVLRCRNGRAKQYWSFHEVCDLFIGWETIPLARSLNRQIRKGSGLGDVPFDMAAALITYHLVLCTKPVITHYRSKYSLSISDISETEGRIVITPVK